MFGLMHLKKARKADEIIRKRLDRLGLEFDEIYTEYIGYNAGHGPLSPDAYNQNEVILSIGARGKNKDAMERFSREIIPLGTYRSAKCNRIWRRQTTC